MSYILDALRKAEQQRRLGDVPGLDEAQATTEDGRQRRLWGWLALGGLNLLLIALLLWPDAEKPLQEVAAGGDSRAALPQQARAKPGQAATQSPAPEQRHSTSPVAPERAAAVSGERPLRAIPPPPRPAKKSTVPASAPVSPEPEQTAAAARAPADIPTWPQVSSATLSQLSGSLRLDVHVYAERPEERFVLINLQKYREGEQLQEGPRLDEVTPDGAILSFNGERFRIKAK